MRWDSLEVIIYGCIFACIVGIIFLFKFLSEPQYLAPIAITGIIIKTILLAMGEADKDMLDDYDVMEAFDLEDLTQNQNVVSQTTLKLQQDPHQINQHQNYPFTTSTNVNKYPYYYNRFHPYSTL
jgi:hypothetical protein